MLRFTIKVKHARLVEDLTRGVEVGAGPTSGVEYHHQQDVPNATFGLFYIVHSKSERERESQKAGMQRPGLYQLGYRAEADHECALMHATCRCNEAQRVQGPWGVERWAQQADARCEAQGSVDDRAGPRGAL